MLGRVPRVAHWNIQQTGLSMEVAGQDTHQNMDLAGRLLGLQVDRAELCPLHLAAAGTIQLIEAQSVVVDNLHGDLEEELGCWGPAELQLNEK